MITSGPLEPSDLPEHDFYPEPIVVPLDFIESQTKMAKNKSEMDETGLYMMSKAVEEFVRQLIQETTQNGAKEFNYDTMAEYIQKSEFDALKDFFPKRVRFGDICHDLFPPQPKADPPSTEPSTSASSN